MSAKAFLFVETSIGQLNKVIDELRQIEGVISVDAVTGPYDIIAVLESDSLNALGVLLTEDIDHVVGISRIVTCLAIGTN
ncbi:Lrp/AsnC ligand binding domain-containing protein [Chloroflexota bacterium]